MSALRVIELDFKQTVTSPPQIAAPRLGTGSDRCCLSNSWLSVSLPKLSLHLCPWVLQKVLNLLSKFPLHQLSWCLSTSSLLSQDLFAVR